MKIRTLVAGVILLIIFLGMIDVLDVHQCNGKVCIARAGNCHICEKPKEVE